MGNVILGPQRAAETVCHAEQLRIWAHELLVRLGMEGDDGYLRDLDDGELVDCERVIADEIKKIVESAFDHPECRSIRIER